MSKLNCVGVSEARMGEQDATAGSVQVGDVKVMPPREGAELAETSPPESVGQIADVMNSSGDDVIGGDVERACSVRDAGQPSSS